MGSSASKAARAVPSAASTVTRKYPTRSTNTPLSSPSPQVAPSSKPPANTVSATTRPQRPGPEVHPPVQASETRDANINLDASDPHFAQSLRNIGPVQPFPAPTPTIFGDGTPSTRRHAPDQTMPPALVILAARERLQKEADIEEERVGREGNVNRSFLDVSVIRQILIMRDGQGKSAKEIEQALGLKAGSVDKLGRPGQIAVPHEVGRAERGVEIV